MDFMRLPRKHEAAAMRDTLGRRIAETATPRFRQTARSARPSIVPTVRKVFRKVRPSPIHVRDSRSYSSRCAGVSVRGF